ncbi:MAG TPA: transporter [Providencia sp.]|uniref:transporter n=1 Tax=Providencia sp. TaxID=589 RepID=UPI000E97BBE5|nr:transporter [Providencia sp.]MBP6081136.1 transporter [Providencia sp.]HBO24821.1 transporter [Providencia sp.]
MKNKTIHTVIFCFLFIFLANAQEMRDPFVPVLEIDSEMDEIPVLALPLKTANKPDIIIVEKIFKLVSIDVQEVYQQLIQPEISLLSNDAIVSHDITTNSLIIKDNKTRMMIIEEWLKQKDVPKHQVQITAHIISSSRTALQELGLEWGMLAGNSTNSHHSRFNRYNVAPGQFSFNLLKLGDGLLELKLNALEKENLLSIIASPRLMASHKQPANIQQGTEIPYVISSDKKTHVQFKDAVLGMDVTPTIFRDEKVELILKISHNSPDTALTTSQNHHLAINKQEISTSVTIKNNETLILGGIFQQKQEKTETGLPFISRIPFLGALFANSAEHIDRRVLVVFITPKLVNI